jgi:hypothetical protein
LAQPTLEADEGAAVVGIVQEDAELVFPEPSNGVVGAHVFLEAACHLEQDGVSHALSKGDGDLGKPQ